MAVFRVEKTKDFTVMSNHHLRNTELSLKAKGLLSLMLSLPEDWDYTTKGLAHICRDGVDSITTALKELERHGYLTRQRLRNENGQLGDIEYTIHEKPVTGVKQGVSPKRENPRQVNPRQAKPEQAEPEQENPAQLNTNPQKLKNQKRIYQGHINQSIRKSRKRQAVRMGLIGWIWQRHTVELSKRILSMTFWFPAMGRNAWTRLWSLCWKRCCQDGPISALPETTSHGRLSGAGS